MVTFVAFVVCAVAACIVARLVLILAARWQALTVPSHGQEGTLSVETTLHIGDLVRGARHWAVKRSTAGRSARAPEQIESVLRAGLRRREYG
jgi:hypothetical protein